jgi:hypothetical protein
LADARERHKSELREHESQLQLSIQKPEAAMSAWQLALKRDDRKPIDPPNPLRSAN